MENSDSIRITRLETHNETECSSGKLKFTLDPTTDTGLLGFLVEQKAWVVVMTVDITLRCRCTMHSVVDNYEIMPVRITTTVVNSL